MDKDAEIKSLEKLAALFGTTAEELYEKTNNSDEVSESLKEASESLKKEISEVLSMLLPRERQILTLRFGLNDGNLKTLDNVGELLGISRDRVRQIEAKALRKLKNSQRLMNLTKTDTGVNYN